MRRLVELDGIRALAAIGVVAVHFAQQTPAEPFVYVGHLAMEFFFVLSGFLITGIILRQAGERGFLFRFYTRRNLRIWPIYYLTFLAYLAIGLLRPGTWPISGWAWYALYAQNVPPLWGDPLPPFAYPFGPTWSLAVEEQFYLIWPALVLAVGRRRVAVFAIAAILIGPIARVAGINGMTLPGRCDGFGFGALLAVMLSAPNPARHRRALIAAAVAGAAFLGLVVPIVGGLPFEYDTPARPIALTAGSLLAFGLVGLAVLGAGRPGRLLAALRWPPLVYLGTISYGIYLYHLGALVAASLLAPRFGLHGSLPIIALASALTLAVATASWFLVEKPILRLKDRFTERPRIATMPAAIPTAVDAPAEPATVATL